MSGKPDASARMGGRTKDARDKLLYGIREMFAWMGPKAARKTLLAVFDDHYLAFANPRPITIARYRCELRRWERFTGSPRLKDITAEHFHQFRQRCLEADLKPSSIEGTVKVAKAVIRFARDAGWIKALPQWGKPLRIVAPEIEPATLEEIELLYRFSDHATRPARGRLSPADWWRAFLTVELFMGLRITDALQRLQWRHIREDHIAFRANKTGRLHIFPRCRVLDAHLRLVDGLGAKLVLSTGGGSVLNPERIREEMKYLCAEAGIRELTPQHLRQACVTNWMICSESAGRIIHGAGLTVAERHYSGKLTILRNALPQFQWPPSMLRFAEDYPAEPDTLRIERA